MKRRVLDIRPTQFSLGMKEVDYRVERIGLLKGKEREDYLHERRTPVVLAPHSRMYSVDHHHLIRACWELGIEEIPVEVKADLSHLSFSEFWKTLQAAHWIFLYDQFGNGPHEAFRLPENIKCLADDAFRSLAWLVRRHGGFEKSEIPFAEFQWANFFRKNLKLHPVFDDMEGAVAEALALCKTPVTVHLPGHIALK